MVHPRRQYVGPFSRQARLVSVFKLTDLVGMSSAFVAAALLVGLDAETPSLIEAFSIRLKLLNFVVLAGLLACWHGCFHALGLYDPDLPRQKRTRLVAAAKAATLGVLFVSVSSILFRIVLVTPAFVALNWGLAVAIVCALRVGLVKALELMGGHGLLQRHVVIAGTGPRALQLARRLEADPDSGVQVVGFVDKEWPGMKQFRDAERVMVGDIKDLAAFVRDHVIDEIILALPLSVLHECRKDLFAVCREHGITMRFPASVLVDMDSLLERSASDRDHVVFTLYHGTIGGWPLLAKRLLDLSVALPLFVTSLPLLALTALCIKATSPGPVLFRQQRVGFNKRCFQMYKFRTMVSDAETRQKELEHLNEMQGPTFKITDDPRVTPLGRILRSTSIDELPQLINVIKGEMSLVGPRPLPLRDVERFEEDRHRRRFSVLPGLTGLWQVSGRSSVSFDRWIDLDLEYVDQWSLVLDLKILARTIPTVLLRAGAH